MTINISVPQLLGRAGPVIRILAVIFLVLSFIAVFSSFWAFLTLVLAAALLLVISLICECIAELYQKIEELSAKPVDPEI